MISLSEKLQQRIDALQAKFPDGTAPDSEFDILARDIEESETHGIPVLWLLKHEYGHACLARIRGEEYKLPENLK